jgi:hypothetical protein
VGRRKRRNENKKGEKAVRRKEGRNEERGLGKDWKGGEKEMKMEEEKDGKRDGEGL